MKLPQAYTKAPLKVAMLAGEPSGDKLGAGVLNIIKQMHPDAVFVGIGGQHMIEAGLQTLYPMERLSIMGFIEPLKRARELLGLRKKLKTLFTDNPPDVFIGIDAPDFNLPLERYLKANGVPTVHYVSPTIWAWRPGRIHKIKQSVDHMLLIFPFEKAIYDKHQVPASFVGHALAQSYELDPKAVECKQGLGLNPNKPVIALLLGSRASEIERLAKDFLHTATLIQKQDPSIQLVVAMHNEKLSQHFEVYKRFFPELKLQTIVNQTQQVLRAADAAMVTSGTATLEASLSKTPHIVVYRMSPITFQIAKRVIKTDYISMTNIMAGKKLVTEYIQRGLDAKKMASELIGFVKNDTRTLVDEFYKMHKSLKEDSNEIAANAVLEVVKSKKASLDKKIININ